MQSTKTLHLETCEERVTPAVVVFNDGNDLRIVGDAENDHIIVQAAPGFAVVTGLNGTLVNGESVAINTAFVAGSVFINLDGGNDSVQIVQTGAVGNVSDLVVNLGSGDDEVTIQGGVWVGRDLSIDLGNGNDTASVQNVIVNQDTLVNGRGGNDEIILQNYPNSEDLQVDAGPGRDFVLAQNIYGGMEDATFDLQGGRDTLIVRDLSVGEDLNINDGRGNDRVLVQNVYFGHEFDVNNPEDGANEIPGDTDFSGLGNDLIVFRSLSNGNDGDNSQWLLNEGHDTMTLQNVNIGEQQFVDVFSFDAVELTIQDARFNSEVNIRVGSSDDGKGSDILMERFYIKGNLTILTILEPDAGQDTVQLHGFSLNGTLDIMTGGEKDRVEISGTHGSKIQVDLGDGDDQLIIRDVTSFDICLDGGSGTDELCVICYWFANQQIDGFEITKFM